MDKVFEAAEAEAYDNWLDSPGGQAYAKATAALLDQILDYRPGWRVLDVGCGSGLHLEHLADKGLLAYGLEAGPVMAKIASRRLGHRAEIEVGDAHDLPYEDNSFDSVILVNTLELVDRRAQVLAEATRVASSRVSIISLDALAPMNWLLGRARPHPYKGCRMLPWWVHFRLVREVLGPVPVNWCAASLWPVVLCGPCPFLGLFGVSAAVTPYYATRPLEVEAAPARAPQPATSAGRFTLRRVK